VSIPSFRVMASLDESTPESCLYLLPGHGWRVTDGDTVEEEEADQQGSSEGGTSRRGETGPATVAQALNGEGALRLPDGGSPTAGYGSGSPGGEKYRGNDGDLTTRGRSPAAATQYASL
jgi:hypothetical protein